MHFLSHTVMVLNRCTSTIRIPGESILLELLRYEDIHFHAWWFSLLLARLHSSHGGYQLSIDSQDPRTEADNGTYR